MNHATYVYGPLAIAVPEPAAAKQEIPVAAGKREQRSEMDVSGSMILLTWATFLLAFIILYKLAWKPILAALDKRENDIRRSLDEAAKARDETVKMQEKQARMIAEADDKARAIIEESRKAAEEISRGIEVKAKEDARFLVEEARRDIEESVNKARSVLRRESASLAVELAGKLVRENMNTARNRELADKLVREL